MKHNAFEKEMNRGFLQLLVLMLLDRPNYGYMLAREIAARGYPVEENSLYPLLRRLETKNILDSSWEIEENNPRKYYVISREGVTLRERLLEIWRTQAEVLDKLLGGSDGV